MNSNYQAITTRVQQSEIKAIAQAIRAQHPTDWANTNDEHAGGRDKYIRRVVWACRGLRINGQQIGCNYKRGAVGQLSLDAIAIVNPSGAQDKTGGMLGLEIVDIILNHARADAGIAWTDVTQATIDSGNGGGYIAPHDPDTTELPGTGGGSQPAIRFPSYGELGDDHFFRQAIGVPLQADVFHAGDALNDGSTVWSSRAVYLLMVATMKHQMKLGPAVNPVEITRGVREEWRAELKRIHPGITFQPF